MQQIRLNTSEAIFYASVIHAVVGLLLGLIPLITGFLKKQRGYGVLGFFASFVGGAILGLFVSLPSAVIFTWLILRKHRQTATNNANANSNSAVTENTEVR